MTDVSLDTVALLLSGDEFLLMRPVGGADEHGNPNVGFQPVGKREGKWGSVRSVDRTEADRMGQRVDAVIAGLFKAKIGDKFANLRGEDYIVTHFHATQLHVRYFLRRV